MSFIVRILLILNMFFPVFISWKNCVSNRALEVNHILLFSFGYVYYFVLPIFVGLNKLFVGLPAMDLWYSIFNEVSDKTIIFYLILIFIFYLSFILGSTRKTKNKKPLINVDDNFEKEELNFFLITGMAISMIFFYGYRNSFFTGYSKDSLSTVIQKGPFIALSLVILALALIYIGKNHDQLGYDINIKGLFFNKFLITYFTVAILILSLGGRLYFVTSIVILLCYYSVYYKKIKLSYVLSLFLLLAISMGTIGVIRLDGSNFSMTSVLFNLFQEPIYVSFSLASFLDINNFKILNLPIYLLSSLINLIPTYVFPNKLDYIIPLADSGYNIYTPLGAVHTFAPLMINFGIFGSAIFLYGVGWFLNRIKSDAKSVLARTIYVSFSGFLTFTFFRDGFETSLIKNIFQFSILMPILIVLSANVLSIIKKNIAEQINIKFHHNTEFERFLKSVVVPISWHVF